MINYDGKEPVADIVKKNRVPMELLPTVGEYLDAEGDEYTEEIAKFEELMFADMYLYGGEYGNYRKTCTCQEN